MITELPSLVLKSVVRKFSWQKFLWFCLIHENIWPQQFGAIQYTQLYTSHRRLGFSLLLMCLSIFIFVVNFIDIISMTTHMATSSYTLVSFFSKVSASSSLLDNHEASSLSALLCSWNVNKYPLKCECHNQQVIILHTNILDYTGAAQLPL